MIKINHVLAFVFLLLLLSCGKTKEEITQEKLQVKLEKEALEKQKEEERIHLEKIEVGKSKLKMELTNDLTRLRRILEKEKNKLVEIRRFKFGRSRSTREKQITAQNMRIGELGNYISRLEKEIALTNLRKTFDFHNTPEGVVQYVFKAAKNKEFENLRYICDPYGENDGDTKKLCLLATQPLEIQNQFVEGFKKGRVMGTPIIENGRAQVEIAFGPGSNRLEQINLIMRMNKWYLVSF